MDEQFKQRLADYFTPAELVDLLEDDDLIYEIIDLLEERIEDQRPQLEEYMKYGN